MNFEFHRIFKDMGVFLHIPILIVDIGVKEGLMGAEGVRPRMSPHCYHDTLIKSLKIWKRRGGLV